MDKAEIRATAEFYEPYLNRADVVDDIEAALTAAYDAGWNERGMADEQAMVGIGGGCLDWATQAIRRLKKGE